MALSFSKQLEQLLAARERLNDSIDQLQFSQGAIAKEHQHEGNPAIQNWTAEAISMIVRADENLQ